VKNLNSLEIDLIGWAEAYKTDGITAWDVAFKRGEYEDKRSLNRIKLAIRKLVKEGLLKKHRHVGRNRYSYKRTRKAKP
jgi:hypothetical protein